MNHTDEPKVHRHRPVIVYLSVMLAAVVLLLIISYVSGLRSSDRIENLTSTVADLQSTMETINEMQATIDTQESLISRMEQQLESLKETKAENAETISDLEQQLADAMLAADGLQYLAELETAYAKGDLTTCRKLISTIEDKGMDKVLPQTAAINGERAPYAVYLTIAEDVQSATGTSGDHMGDLP